jgi:multidrug efflux system membrane fusion protein
VAFKEGQDVQKGELLAEIDPAPYKALYDQAVAKKAQDEATLANARLDLKRDTELVASQVVSGQTFDTQQSLVRQLEASVQADVAAIASAKVNLDYTSISSPLNGRIGIRQVDVGNIVHATDTNGLVVVTQLRPIGVLFTLQEQTLWNIQQHMKTGDMKVLAVDRDNSTVLAQGKLVVIDNQIDTTTGTIRLKAAFPNDDLRLWPGQFVNARLLLTVRTNGLVVPAQVIQRGPAGEYAFVLNRDGTNTFAKVRPVKVAQIDAGLALIDSGLNTGETVVVDGQYKLQDGSPVRVVRSAKAEDEPASE